MTKLFYPWEIVVQTLLSTVRISDECSWALCILRVWWPIVWRLLNCRFIALSVKEDNFSHEKARTQNWDMSISSFTESLIVISWKCKSLCGYWTNMGREPHWTPIWIFFEALSRLLQCLFYQIHFTGMCNMILSQQKKTHFKTLLTPIDVIDSKESICWHQFKSDHMASRQNCFAHHF